MIFAETKLKGAFIIETERLEDERGFFARSYCQKEFVSHGLSSKLVQCNISFNKRKGTLRGMHYQVAPHEEAKLVRCTKGAIYDVIVDLRANSPTFKEWISVELTAENHRMLYIPEGFAHGFQTLEDNTEVFYQMSELYHAESARGVRWDDPIFGIDWPLHPSVISSKDQAFKLFQLAQALCGSRIEEMIFWGATGQAKVLRDCLQNSELKLVALFDNNKNVVCPFSDINLFFGKDEFEDWLKTKKRFKKIGFLVAIGGDKGKDRIELQNYLEKSGLIAILAKHPTAYIADNVKIGAGSQVLAQASVCVETIIGRGCIINTGAIVDHECSLDDGVHVCPGAHLAGCIEVGRYATIGTGAVILPRIKIGEGSVVGAGAVVTKDVPPYTVVVGNPARILRTRESDERSN